VLGRPLGGADDPLPVVVISHRLWQRRFSGSPSILGSHLMLDSQPHTIVGVVDATFQLPNARIDVWRTAGFASTLNPALAQRGSGGFLPIGRLKRGATIEQARMDCTDVLRALTAMDPRYGGRCATVFSLRDGLVANVRPALLVLFAAVGLVLFVTCANVTNLLLARNVSRTRERAIRLALGASRGRLAAQSLVDSALIAIGGGVVGVAVAMWTVATLTKLNPAGIPRLDAVRLDLPVLLFALMLAAATTIVIGVLPACHAVDVTSALKLGGRGSTSGLGARRVRRLLVVAELAVSLVLLVGASLLGRSLFRLLNADLGATTAHVTAVLVDVSYGRVLPLAESRALIERIVDRVRQLPGVTSAGAGVAVPPNRARLRFTMNRVDEAVGQPTNYLVDAVSATPEFFTTLGVRLQRGRFFTEADNGEHQHVMIMSANTARQIFGDRDPIGRSVALPILTGNPNGRAGNAPVTVVGIVDNVKYSGLDTPPDGVIYRPFAQQPWQTMFIVLRTGRDIEGLDASLRRAIAAVDRSTVVYSIDTLDGLVSTAAAQPRFRTVVLLALAGLTLALAAVGLYGVVAYAVVQRMAEIGIRMALGAAAGDVMRLVLREGLILASTGIALGLLVARALTRVVANLLYGVQPVDLASFVGAAAVLLLVTIVASYIPARRAVRIDSLVALRSE
jgi:putative ABC transport system permease protein